MATPKKAPGPKRHILSLKEAPAGVDILGTTDYTLIVRSDLDCYLTVEDLEKGSTSGSHGPAVLNLHPQCSGGDHYFAVQYSNTLIKVATGAAKASTVVTFGWLGILAMGKFGGAIDDQLGSTYTDFYILKGNEFRVVKSLSTAEDSRPGKLHPKCQGGDFYMATSEYHVNSTTPIFIIVREKEGKFETFKDLETGEHSENYKDLYEESHYGPYNLHEKCKGGLYYWATKSETLGSMWYYILKDMDSFGVVTVHWTTNLRTDADGKDVSLHISLINFVPGGLSHNLKGKWDLLKQIGGDKLPKPWSYREVTKVGYSKETLHSVQHHWDTKMKYQVEQEAKSGFLVEKVFSTSLKQQFSFEASYGGYVLDTTTEKKSEEKTTAVKLSGTIEPHGTISIWQYVIMLMSENKVVFATPHVQQTDSRDPPDYEPQMEMNPEDMVK